MTGVEVLWRGLEGLSGAAGKAGCCTGSISPLVLIEPAIDFSEALNAISPSILTTKLVR